MTSEKQIIEAAKTFGNLHYDHARRAMFTELENGSRKYFGFRVYRDSLHLLARAGKLTYDAATWSYKAV